MSVGTVRTERVVGVVGGLDRWAQEAFRVLAETAMTYNATITTADLAEAVQQRSGLRTTVAPRSWVGKVLDVVVGACHQGGLPPLSALVVGKDGQVGRLYDAVLLAQGRPPLEDPHERELDAAAARLECYRRYCEDVPADAAPTLVEVARPAGRHAGARTTPGSRATSTPRATGTRSAASTTRATGSRAAAAHPEPAPPPVCPRCFTQLPAVGGACNYCD